MEVLAKVLVLQKQVDRILAEKSHQNEALEIRLLQKLSELPIDLKILTKTKIGVTVNLLRKRSMFSAVSTLAKAVIKKWKRCVPVPPKPKMVESTSSSTTSPSSPSPSSPPSPAKNNAAKKEMNDLKTGGEPSLFKKRKIKRLKRKIPSFKKSSKLVVSFPPASTTTNDAVRLKCRELLLSAIQGDGILPSGTNDPNFLAGQLEEHIYKEFNNTEIKYKNRIRSRVANLKDHNNPNLRLNFLSGDISPLRLAKMTAEQMASQELKAARAKFWEEGLNDAQLTTTQGTKTDLLKCNQCNQRECSYNQLQTESADEPMTTFVLCNTCGNRWKFN